MPLNHAFYLGMYRRLQARKVNTMYTPGSYVLITHKPYGSCEYVGKVARIVRVREGAEHPLEVLVGCVGFTTKYEWVQSITMDRIVEMANR